MLCHLPGGEAMAGNSLSSGLWARTGLSEKRPLLPEDCFRAALARMAFHPPCGRPDRAVQQQNTGTVRRNGIIIKMLKKNNKKVKSQTFNCYEKPETEQAEPNQQ